MPFQLETPPAYGIVLHIRLKANLNEPIQGDKKMHNEQLELIRKSYDFSLNLYNELNNKFDDENHDEEYDDTLTRKYEEGFSDAIAHVFNILGISIEKESI